MVLERHISGDERFSGVASVSIIYPDYVFKSIKKRNSTSN